MPKRENNPRIREGGREYSSMVVRSEWSLPGLHFGSATAYTHWSPNHKNMEQLENSEVRDGKISLL